MLILVAIAFLISAAAGSGGGLAPAAAKAISALILVVSPLAAALSAPAGSTCATFFVGTVSSGGFSMAESTAHISSAIGWTSSMLTYVGPGVLLSEGWYGKYPECSDAARAAYEQVLGKRPACDEFPYLRTWEGGETNYLAGKVSLKLLDLADNSVGGSMFRAFLRRCKVNKSERFRVVPVSGTSHGTDKNGAPCM